MGDVVINEETGLPYRSYSAFTQWAKCGKAYQLARIAHVPERPAWWFIGGSAVHATTEAYDRHTFEAGQ